MFYITYISLTQMEKNKNINYYSDMIIVILTFFLSFSFSLEYCETHTEYQPYSKLIIL